MQIYLPIAEMPVNIFLLFFMGAAVGFVSGLFGVGGGFLLTPFLIFIGIPPAVAVATSSAQIAASSVTGAMNYWRRGTLDFKLGWLLVSGGLIGTYCGILFFNAMRRIGQLELIISVSYVTLLVGIGTLMLVESLKSLRHQKNSGRQVTRTKRHQHRWYEQLPFKLRFVKAGLYVSAIPFLFVGVVFGFIGAVLGIGGGFMVVPTLLYVFHIRASVVLGLSLFQILFTMLAATMLHAVSNGTVDLVLALILIVGGVIGAQIGARSAQRIGGEHFRLLLALLILAVGMRFMSDLIIKPDEAYSISLTGSR